METIRVFAIAKIGWIRKQQAKLREQDRETSRDYVDRESHFVWGRRYLLKVVEANAAPRVQLEHGTMLLRVRPAGGHGDEGGDRLRVVSPAPTGGGRAPGRDLGTPPEG